MGKAEIYKELAEKDMLTKCYNRNAYNEQSKNVHMQIASGLTSGCMRIKDS